ncbi:MAG: hypothetical protein RL497_1413 [Pseudomonadota bacterium]|jgi:diguanylate cyclase (GGDEF)-like protein
MIGHYKRLILARHTLASCFSGGSFRAKLFNCFLWVAFSIPKNIFLHLVRIPGFYLHKKYIRKPILGVLGSILFTLPFTTLSFAINNPDNLHFVHLLTNNAAENLNAIGTPKFIAQDRIGYMWFVGEHGIARYDSNRIRIYNINSKKSVSPATYTNLVEDNNGVLWIGSNAGLAYYSRDLDRFVSVDANSSLKFPNSHVTALAADKSNRLYVGSLDGLAVISADRNRVTHYPGNLPEQRKKINHLFVAPNQQVWIGTDHSGLQLFNPDSGEFKYWHINLGAVEDGIVRVLEDSNGNVWAGSFSMGLAKMNADKATFTLYKNDNQVGSLKSNYIRDIFEDADRHLWIATGTGGLSRFDPTSARFNTQEHDPFNPHSLSSSHVRTLFQDRQSNFWVGTFPNGINFYDARTSRFTVYNHQKNLTPSLPSNDIYSIYEDKEGMIWIGSAAGLSELNPTTQSLKNHTIHTPELNRSNEKAITSILEDTRGYLWICSWGEGLNRFDRGNNTFKHYAFNSAEPKNLPSHHPWQLGLTKQNELWVSFNPRGGVARYQHETDNFEHFTHQIKDENSLSSNDVQALLPDKNGNLWLGTIDGLDYLNLTTMQFSHYYPNANDSQTINCANILSLLEGKDGTIWIGTECGGVNIYNPKSNTFKFITPKDGLPSATVTSLLEDKQGSIWAATINGLARINPLTLAVETLRSSDGLAGDHIAHNTLMQDKNGYIWVGSTQGLTRFNPDIIKAPTEAPVVVLTEFSVGHAEQIPGAPHSVLKKSIEETTEIHLTHKQNTLHFEFSALSFSSSQHNKYTYKLDGFEENWNTGNTATYTDLDSGRYVFRVKAANSDNVWNETGKHITLIIHPPFWRTTWAYFGYSLILIASVIYFMRKIKDSIAADKYKNLATMDPLTGIYNRVGIAAIVEGLFINSEMKQGVCLLMLDVDHFKRINDRRGHEAGDRILQELVVLINRNIRTGDYFARWGGEEFILLCPSTTLNNAKNLAEKLRLACANYFFEAKSAPIGVTLSIGIACCKPEDDFTLLLKRADNALYRAKNSGRNCIEVEDIKS